MQQLNLPLLMERQEASNEQLFGLRSRSLPVCLCCSKCFFLWLMSIQLLWKRAFRLLCLVDDFDAAAQRQIQLWVVNYRGGGVGGASLIQKLSSYSS